MEIVSGQRVCALVGFDMNPRRRNSLEIIPRDDVPTARYRDFIRRVGVDKAFRRSMGIRPGKETKIPLRKITN